MKKVNINSNEHFFKNVFNKDSRFEKDNHSKKKIANIDDLKRYDLLEGFQARFFHTDNFTMVYWEVRAGLPLPVHQHPHEQTSYILEGELEAEIDGNITILKPGDFCLISPNSMHGGKALTNAKLIDVFHPVREDYKTLSEE